MNPSKILTVFCSSMGLYGASRGYRSSLQFESKHQLTSEKITNAVINGLFYAIPVVNIGPTIRLINRVEIAYRGLNPSDYKEDYKEIMGGGVCDKTI